MFVKPMLARVQGTQSGGAVYRRVVLRNLLSTTGIVISYAITTLVVVLALLRENVNDNKVRFVEAYLQSPYLAGAAHVLSMLIFGLKGPFSPQAHPKSSKIDGVMEGPPRGWHVGIEN